MAARVAERPVASPRPRLVTPVFLLITFATFAYFVSVGALIPTLPLYVEGPLGGGDVAVGVGIGAFSLSAVLLRPFSGRLSDVRGRRLLLVAGAGLVTLSVAGYVFATSFAALVALRLVTGAGEAFFYVGAASAINDIAPDERRGEALSFFSLALYAGLAIGPVLGEMALGTDRFDAAWLLSAGAAAVALLLGWKVPDTRPPGVSSGSAALVHRAALVPGTVLAASVWGLAGFSTFVPLYARELGLEGASLVFVTYSSLVLALRLFGARIPDKLGTRLTARLALTASALGMAVLGFWSASPGLFVGGAIFGVGQALAFPALMSIAVRGAPASERGAVVGTFTAFFDLAFGLGAVTLGAVASRFGYAGSFRVAGLVALGGLGLLYLYARRDAAAGPVLDAPPAPMGGGA
ncbi:MAG: MFS transporter [Actinomycetota bacterium]|nr:MFS transporter [Actinomycetota bacterium]MDQ3955043.1 MFS transporter [Actinomycetota bacterium]